MLPCVLLSVQILVSRLNLRACSSPLLIQVLLALYQRLVPLPAFQPTAPLPQQLTQPQPQQLARKIIASLSDWVKDPEALALLVLQHRNHYQMLLQTLMALCIYVPPFPPAQAAASSPSEARIEGDAHDKQQHQQNMSSASSYEANCSSLTLLASLIPSVGEALRSKGGAVSACLAAAANAASAASTGGCATWKARLDCQAMWLQSMQVLAIVCSFSARPVKVKALAVGPTLRMRVAHGSMHTMHAYCLRGTHAGRVWLVKCTCICVIHLLLACRRFFPRFCSKCSSVAAETSRARQRVALLLSKKRRATPGNAMKHRRAC